MRNVLKLLFFTPILVFGQGQVSQVNCPNPFTPNQIIVVQAVHASPFINAPSIILGCYQLDSGAFTINNTTTPPTITISSGIISNGVVVNFADSEVPSGTLNGSNVTFTVVNTPTSGSLKLFKNGLRMKPGLDYTISVATITFLFTPQVGDILLCDYRY